MTPLAKARGLCDGLMTDARYTMRGLLARPGFALSIILTLAIGIGATTAIFSVVDAVVLHPLPYPNPDRILSLSQTANGSDFGVVDELTYGAWDRSARSISVAAYTSTPGVMAFQDGPERLLGYKTTLGYFDILGVRPVLGRAPTANDFASNASNVMVLSEQLWRRAFGGEESVLGRTINVNDQPTTIIGVMPAWATSQTGPQFWMPFGVRHSSPGAIYFWSVVAHLSRGASIGQARAELQTLTATVTLPSGKHAGAPVVMTLAERLYGEQRRPVLLLFGAVVVLLLIACANVANLTLVRAAGRQRELSVRLALGAGRARLARLFLSESMLLALVGGALSLALAHGLIAYFAHLSPASVGNLERVRLDAIVLTFTAAIAIGSALVFAVAPVIVTGRGDIARALSTGTPRATAGSIQHVVRRGLVVAQLATALALLTGAGLVARSFYRVTAVDLGFNPNRLISTIVLPPSRYVDARIGPTMNAILRQIRALPGVESAAFGLAPLSGWSSSYSPRDSSGQPLPPIDEIQVGRDYFRTIGARLVAGRAFVGADNPRSPLVVVVNEALAQRLYPAGNAIGRTVAGPDGKATIIGIVANIRPQVEAHASGVVYPSVDQAGVNGYEQVLVRTSGPPSTTEDAIKQIMHAMDPLLPPPQMQRMNDVVAQAVAPRKFVFVLLAMFASLAALLAVIGLYGVLSRVVLERTREIGIRVALGAEPRGVIGLVLGQALSLVVIGVVLGAAGSLAAARLMQSLVYDTSVHDPLVFGAAMALLVGVAVLASYLPARRATAVDPVTALRHE